MWWNAKCPFANRFPLTISSEARFALGEFITALCRKMGLPIPLLLLAVRFQLSNNASSVKGVGGRLRPRLHHAVGS